MGRSLVPGAPRFVSALAKTRNAKVVQRVVSAPYLGKDPGDLAALENRDAVQEIEGVPGIVQGRTPVPFGA